MKRVEMVLVLKVDIKHPELLGETVVENLERYASDKLVAKVVSPDAPYSIRDVTACHSMEDLPQENESENPRWHMAKDAANKIGYNPEFDGGFLLSEIVAGDGGDKYIPRYLMIARENAGDGPVNYSLFFSIEDEAREMMSEYARSGWVSFLFDLDDGGECIARWRMYCEAAPKVTDLPSPGCRSIPVEDENEKRGG